jgi:hypothetical protein
MFAQKKVTSAATKVNENFFVFPFRLVFLNKCLKASFYIFNVDNAAAVSLFSADSTQHWGDENLSKVFFFLKIFCWFFFLVEKFELNFNEKSTLG